MSNIRYRVGIDQGNGQTLVGYDHVLQSLAKISSPRRKSW